MERGSGDNKLLDNEWHGYIYIPSFFSCLITAFRWLSIVVALNICIHFFDSDVEVWKVYMDFVYMNKRET